MHKIYLTLIVIWLVTFSSVLLAQEGFIDVPIPSPESAKLAQFSLSPPNYYTGVQSISVPLYSFEFEGKQIGLGLNYHGGGVRVAEDSGNVGLGWTLGTIGSINRSVKGLDDFGNGSSSNRSFLGYINDAEPIPSQFTEAWFNDYLTANKQDTEPDIFSYSFLGTSGKFILSKKQGRGEIISILKLSKNNDLIEFDKVNQIFSITDSEGFKGFFSIKEYSTGISGICQNSWENCPENIINLYDGINNGGRSIIGWHLEKIVSPRGRELELKYDLNQTNGFSDYLSLSAKTWSEINSSLRVGTTEPENIKSYGRSIHENIYLSSIESQDYDLKITLDYEPREDITPLDDSNVTYTDWRNSIATDRGGYMMPCKMPKKLAGINISNYNTVSYLNLDVVFHQSYFNSGNNDKQNFYRLRLDSVSVADQQYKFKYFGGVPSKNSKGIDYWGFYNGKDSNLELAPVIQFYPNLGVNYFPYLTDNFYFQSENRAANFNFGKAGLLYEMEYPTGGRSLYEYEPHEYRLTGMEKMPPGESNINSSALIINEIKEFYYKGYGNDGCGGIEITLRSRCRNFFDNSPKCFVEDSHVNLPAAQILDSLDNVVLELRFDFLRYSDESIKSYEIVRDYPDNPVTGTRLPAGNYKIKTYGFKENDIVKYYGEARVNLNENCVSNEEVNEVEYNQFAGGARIKSIAVLDIDGAQFEKKIFQYKTFTGNEVSQNYSSGKLVNPLMQLSQFAMSSGVLYYINTSGSALSNGNAAQGNHIGYSEVREINVDGNGENKGYTDYRFKNKPNEYIPFYSGNAVSGTNVITYEDENGQRNFSGIYDESSKGNLIVSEGFIKDSPDFIPAVKLFYTNPGSRPMTNFYKVNTGTWQLYSKTVNKEGFFNWEYFEYNDDNQLKRHIRSFGNPLGESVTAYEYPTDVANPGAVVSLMKAKNIVGKPFETRTYLNGNLISSQGVLYGQATTGLGEVVVPKRIFDFDTDQVYVSTDGESFAGGYFERKEVSSYDIYGNPEETTDNGVLKSSYVWAYNGIYPIAVTSNASIAQVAHTSFETAEKGGWVYEGVPEILQNAKTGRSVYRLTEGQVTKNQLPQGEYRVSFWARSESGVQSYTFLGETQQIGSDWVLVERVFSGNSIAIPAGGILIDELRLHPENAQMQTYSYDPMIGATSVTDSKNLTTYYEYDSFGRLLRVRDHEHNILGQTEYYYTNSGSQNSQIQ